VLKHDAATGRSSLEIDLKGRGNADFMVKSVGQIKPGDVLWQGQKPQVRPLPAPTPPSPLPAPAPLPSPSPPESKTDTLSALNEVIVKILSTLLQVLQRVVKP
jgi:hypothetical protein